MDILNTISLNSNTQIKIDFNGGDLSSDAGLLLIKEFAAKIGFSKLIKTKFKTNDTHVHIYCHKHGYGSISNHPVLLWAWENGKLH